MGDRLEVTLLGPVRLMRAGQAVDLAGVSQRVLLARLALAEGREVPASELTEALWGENPPANAAGNLRSYLSRLRRSVGDRLERLDGGHRLRLAPDELDIARAERLVARARAADRPGQAAELLGEALALWRGRPLSDLPDVLPFAADVARLEELRLQVVEQRLELLLDAGRPDAALPELEHAVHDEPLRERLHVLLMRALSGTGRAAEALQVARSYRTRLAEETGLDPGSALADMERRVLAGEPAAPSPPAGGVPVRPGRDAPARRRYAPADRFIGREPDMRALREALDAHRAVAVAGPGGAGKTRLVYELLDRWHDRPVTFVAELEQATDAGDVTAAVAAAVGLQAAPEGLAMAIADRLGADRALVVLDGCEHVREAVRYLGGFLLSRCPGVTLLATSRRRLDLPAERVLRIGPLPDADQVALFCDRVALLRAGFDAAASAAVVADICRRVDGLPLGVELAARREAVFGVEHLRDRLSAGLDVLEPVGGAERGVRATVEWSYRLLDPAAQALFDRLTVCHGGFGLDAVEHLAPPGAANPPALLAELVEASLVVADLGADPVRYRVLETMRDAGTAHLTSDGMRAARDAHVRWMRAHIDRVHDLQTARAPGTTRVLHTEIANVRAALAWASAARDDEEAAVFALKAVLAVSDEPHLGLLEDARRWHAEGPVRDTTGALWAMAAGGAAWLRGESGTAEGLLSAALEHLRAGDARRWPGLLFRVANRMSTGDVGPVEDDAAALTSDPYSPPWVRATGVCCAALTNCYTGRLPGARSWLERHGRLLDEVAAADGLVLYTRGELAAAGGDAGAALRWLDQAYQRADAHGQGFNREVARVSRAAVLLRAGRHAEAARACGDGLRNLRALGIWDPLWTCLRLTAELLVAAGDLETAAVVLSAADADPLAPAVTGPDLSRRDHLWRRIRGVLEPARVTALAADGRTMARAQVVDTALRAVGRLV